VEWFSGFESTNQESKRFKFQFKVRLKLDIVEMSAALLLSLD